MGHFIEMRKTVGRQTIGMWCLGCMFVTTLLVSSPEVIAKDNGGIPPVVLSGLDAYKEGGAEAAFNAWLSGSPSEGDKSALSQANIFRQVETLYGAYQGFDPIKIVNLTPKTTLVYLQINFQKGPLFASFLCYREVDNWIIPMLTFNTEVEKIIPSEILYSSD